jgi:threonine/homoserine/homoserine lactone efflux protein
MTIESAFIFVISLILYWIKPGPSQAAIITRSLNDGFWPAFAIAVGAMVSGVIYFIIAVMGVSFIQDNTSLIAVMLKLLGAAYFVYLGYTGLQNINSGRWTGKKDNLTKKELIKNFMAGFIVELSSPITIFYFIALLPLLMPVQDVTLAGTIIGAILILYFGLLTYTIIISLAVQVKSLLSETQIVRKINLITSVSFIIIGAFLFFAAVSGFDGAFDFN